MSYQEESSYINKNESVSIGNKVLYDLCESFPMNDNVNGLIAKLWLIGRSYAASIERRNYGKEYSKVKDNENKLDLNTGSNGTDSFFKKVSENIIKDKEYEEIVNVINELKDKKYTYNFNNDKEILNKTCELIIKFNALVRRAIELSDKDALEKFEEINKKSKEERNLRYFISFSSKFLHFHLSELVFIYDSFSFSHAKRKSGKSQKSNYIFIDEKGNTIFEIPSDNVKSLDVKSNNEKEKYYVQHVERCYTIMCKLNETYNCEITPRMLDNFLMNVNTKSKKEDVE